MKVIKITKHSQNSTGLFYIILEDWKCFKEEDGSLWEENIEYYVDDRCNEDGAGHNYGWRVEWEVVEDVDLIKEVIEKEIVRKTSDISRINERIELLKTELC